MRRMFDPFEQGNRSFERRFGGLGLGLAISKSLAQAHGGTLIAQSGGRDCGSTFIFSMPTLSPAEVATVPRKTTSEAAQQGLKILLVEDHEDTCAALDKLLAGGGRIAASSRRV